MIAQNIFSVGQIGESELVQTLCCGKNCRVERIVSNGQVSPDGFWYDQEEDEWVLLLQGAAGLALADGSSLYLQSGQYIVLPAHCRHRVEYTSSEPPCIWLCVFGKFK